MNHELRQNAVIEPAPQPATPAKDLVLAIVIATGLALALVAWWSA
jgi:hypothetical protein